MERQGEQLRHIKIIVLFAILASAMLVACGSGSAPTTDGNAVNLTVTAKEFSFDPNTLTVAPGQTVNLTLKNDGSIEHTVMIAAINFKLTAPAKNSASKIFTAPTTPGTYSFICDVAGHEASGMSGKLVVK